MSDFMKSLSRIAIPVTLQSMLQASFSIIDQIMIGQLGEVNIALLPVIMIIDTIGTWGIGIPLCLLAAFGLHWGIVGVYALLTTEEIFRLAVSLVIFKKRSWMISL